MLGSQSGLNQPQKNTIDKTVGGELLARQMTVVAGIDAACNRLYHLKQRIFGPEPEQVGEASTQPPTPNGYFPALFDSVRRGEECVKVLHSLIEQLDQRFPEAR